VQQNDKNMILVLKIIPGGSQTCGPGFTLKVQVSGNLCYSAGYFLIPAL